MSGPSNRKSPKPPIYNIHPIAYPSPLQTLVYLFLVYTIYIQKVHANHGLIGSLHAFWDFFLGGGGDWNETKAYEFVGLYINHQVLAFLQIQLTTL